MGKTKEKCFKENLERLETIVSELDDGNLPLDDMIKIYEEGMKLSSDLRSYLDAAELKIIDISKKKIDDSE